MTKLDVIIILLLLGNFQAWYAYIRLSRKLDRSEDQALISYAQMRRTFPDGIARPSGAKGEE